MLASRATNSITPAESTRSRDRQDHAEADQEAAASEPHPRQPSSGGEREDHREGNGEGHHGRQLEGVGGEPGRAGDVVADDRGRRRPVAHVRVALLDEARRCRLEPEGLLGRALPDGEDRSHRDEGHHRAEHEPATGRRVGERGDGDGEDDVERQRDDQSDRGQEGLVVQSFEVVDGRGHGHDHEEAGQERRATHGQRTAAVERPEQADPERDGQQLVGPQAESAHEGDRVSIGDQHQRRDHRREEGEEPSIAGRFARLRRRTGGDWCHGHRTGAAGLLRWPLPADAAASVAGARDGEARGRSDQLLASDGGPAPACRRRG